VHKAVFLDRDGAIARDVPYCSRPEDFELLPGAAEGVRLLNEHGFEVAVITNLTRNCPRMLHRRHVNQDSRHKMRRESAKHEAHVDAIYYCPHHPADNCECRKPKPKMVFQAALGLDIDLSQPMLLVIRTWMSSWQDKQAARQV